MARLTKDDWLALQKKWEESDKSGFDWLVQDAGGISRQAISKYARQHGWCKKSEQPKVAQQPVAQPEVMPKQQANSVKKQKHKKSCATNY
ncbi:hypothetical protein [Methylocucumis oryzae]|uniref:Uncharacterized protein n=1 Tax=Methylocucumis oryzae TaxID=1632867 RepID=A0A0F3IQY9_9GAMM|nr:hypothetical protein [Methylocucumis oryzae]KJV08024.1 hypothetical protein VZ94_01025 [Methylocucumis oryzae]